MFYEYAMRPLFICAHDDDQFSKTLKLGGYFNLAICNITKSPRY